MGAGGWQGGGRGWAEHCSSLASPPEATAPAHSLKARTRKLSLKLPPPYAVLLDGQGHTLPK